MSGSIVGVVEATDDEVDAFITGHTHQVYNGVIDGRIVIQAGSGGTLLTDIDLVISNKTHDVVEASSRNLVVTRDVPKNPEVTELVN